MKDAVDYTAPLNCVIGADTKRQRGRKVRLQRERTAGAENCQRRCDGLCATWEECCAYEARRRRAAFLL